jgi:hypothetical protein
VLRPLNKFENRELNFIHSKMQRQKPALTDVTVREAIRGFNGFSKLLAPRKRRRYRAPQQADIKTGLITFIQQELL